MHIHNQLPAWTYQEAEQGAFQAGVHIAVVSTSAGRQQLLLTAGHLAL